MSDSLTPPAKLDQRCSPRACVVKLDIFEGAWSPLDFQRERERESIHSSPAREGICPKMSRERYQARGGHLREGGHV